MTVLLQTPVSGQVLSKQANLQPGAVPAIMPEATARENSVFKAGTEISSQADDNAANNDRHKLFDAITVFQPFASWSRTGPRLTSALHYSAGIGFDQQIPIRNMMSQAAEADVLYRFSRRISAHVTGRFTDSSNPFDRLRSSELAPGSSLIAGPNTSVFATAIRTTFEDMNGAVTYRLSRKSSVGAGSSFDSETYRPLVETSVADR